MKRSFRNLFIRGYENYGGENVLDSLHFLWYYWLMMIKSHPKSNINFSESLCLGIAAFIAVSLFFADSTFAAPPTVSFTGTPSTVKKGQYVTLVWRASDANYCSVSGGWNGTFYPPYGSASLLVERTTEFSIGCAGPDGITSASVNIVVVESPPLVNLSAEKTVIAPGETTRLVWSSSGASSCFVSGGWTGTRGLSGSEFATPPIDTLYTITCTNGPYSASDSETIHIGSSYIPTTATFAASCVATPKQAKLDQTVSFSAGSSGGQGTVTYEWNGAVIGSGATRTASFSTYGSKIASLIATDGAGKKIQASCSTEVVNPAPLPTPPPPKSTSLPPAVPPKKVVEVDVDAMCLAEGYTKTDTGIAENTKDKNGQGVSSETNKNSLSASLISAQPFSMKWLISFLFSFIAGIAACLAVVTARKKQDEKQTTEQMRIK